MSLTRPVLRAITYNLRHPRFARETRCASKRAVSTRHLQATQVRQFAQVAASQPSRSLDVPAPELQDGKITIYSDASQKHVAVPAAWLRDHCPCNQCVHETTKQRLIETFDDIPDNIGFSSNAVKESADSFSITWNDGHKSQYPKAWLAASGLKAYPRSTERLGAIDADFWTGESIKASPPTISYSEVMSPGSEAGVATWLSLIRRYGFSYVSDVPVTPEASQELLERIAFIRHTHYGGFYDFTADLSKGDTAYTQLAIGPHTDNTYFSDPAGLQMFHLLSHTDGEGGASQLVDGFGAADELKRSDPEAYKILSTVRVHTHASGNEDSSIQPYQAFPTLVHDPQSGELVQVRWNVTDRAAVDVPMEEMGAWYDAARKWSNILRKREYWEQLQPGKPLIFDNWRVLHGRSAFTGKRRMCGGYINRDDFISRYKITNFGRAQVLESVARG